MPDILTEVHGRKLGVGATGELISNDLLVTMPCVNATVVVSAEAANVRTVTIQLLDANGADLAYVETVQAFLFTDVTRTAFTTTGGSTGIAIGTDGALLALVAKKAFVLTSESDGDIDLTYTDTGTDVAFIGVCLPNGRFVMGDQALTCT